MAAEQLDVARCDALVRGVVAGEAHLFGPLSELLWPEWLRILRAGRALGPLAKSEDDVLNVATSMIEKLQKDDFRVLREIGPWLTRNPDKTLADWNRIVTTREATDYVRSRLGRRRTDSAEPSVKRFLNELRSALPIKDVGVRPPYTDAQAVRQILELAASKLPDAQLGALRAWLWGLSFEEIAVELGVGVDEATKLQRAAVGTLRRHFHGSTC